MTLENGKLNASSALSILGFSTLNNTHTAQREREAIFLNFFLRANRITKNISPSLIHTHKKRGTLLRRRLRERREEGVSLLLRESSFFSLSPSLLLFGLRALIIILI